MLKLLSFVAVVAPAASSDCVFPTEYGGHSFDGCTTHGHHEAWCYTDSHGHWRACTASDQACSFPFTYAGEDYWECTTEAHDQPWCATVGGGWKNCNAQPVEAPHSGSFGTTSGSQGWVDDHNHFRAQHGAGPVTWDSDLADKASTWAEKLNDKDSMFHSDSYNIWPASGENLAWGYGGCSAATGDGGPRLYDGDYDQHCAVASWYGEFYLWRGSGKWQGVNGLGHFTAMVWKGVDAIGCASAGHYYVCEYGSKHCKSHDKYGGQSCWASNPPHLPNFNKNQCSGGACVQALFSLSDAEQAFSNKSAGGMTQMVPASAFVAMLVAGSALLARRLRAKAPVHLEEDGNEEGSILTNEETPDA